MYMWGYTSVLPYSWGYLCVGVRKISRISSYVAMSQNFHIRNFYVELFSFVSHCIHPIVHEIASGDCYPQPASTTDSLTDMKNDCPLNFFDIKG